MLAVSYIRVSTRKQGVSGLGLSAQRDTVVAFAAAHNMDLVGEYSDIESGSHNDRPGLAAALEHCRLTGAVLLIAKLDRLSRNALFLLQLQAARLPFIACDMPQANELTVGVMALIAEQERKATSVRTREALRQAKARGTRLGNPNGARAFGENVRKNAAEGSRKAAEEFAAVVGKRIVNLRENGLSLRAIADQLNADHIQTRQGGVWHACTVRNILNRVAA